MHLCSIKARRLAWRPVRRNWLGLLARLVFDRPCTWAEAPALLKLAAEDLGERLHSVAEQQLTPMVLSAVDD